MAHSNSWNETIPTNSTLATSIDDEIKKLRLDCRERLAVDHYFTSSDSGEATRGMHKQITFYDNVTAPTVSGDESAIYPSKLGSGIVIPMFKNATSSTRILLGDANCKVWMYTNTAPVGWEVTGGAPTDCVLAAVGGSTYTTAGATAGAWTISGFNAVTNHQHTGPNHIHQVYTPGGSGESDKIYSSSGVLTQITNQDRYFSGAETKLALKGHPGTNDPDFIVSLAISWGTSYAGTGVTGLAGGHTPTQDGTWRIAAAVNKLYSPDIT